MKTATITSILMLIDLFTIAISKNVFSLCCAVAACCLLWLILAIFLNRDPDITSSYSLECQCDLCTGLRSRQFSEAIPGENPSDFSAPPPTQ